MRKIKKNKKINKYLILIIIVIFITIPISILIYKHYQKNKDIYKNTNLLLGSWIYNEYNGTYVFNDDYTYIQYTNDDTSNNYCKGTYKYTYGATNKEGLTIRQDEEYYYYELLLNIKMCYIMNKPSFDKYTKKIFFGIKKNNNKDEILFINAETENIFTLNKIKK